MPSSESSLTIISVSGPFREPREQVFSYDYAVQRSTWPTPHGVRVKISLPHELEVFRGRLDDHEPRGEEPCQVEDPNR